MTTASMHRAVLLNETIEGLNLSALSADGWREILVLDATFGGGGHSKAILEKYPRVKIVAFDQDAGAWRRAEAKFKGLERRIAFVNADFRDLEAGLPSDEKVRKFDALVFDLGISSDQLENSGRGFSFMRDEPLLMTMKENPLPSDLTGMDVVNVWSEESLADIIHGYGEERFARRIARGIVEGRARSEIKTTKDLLKIIEDSVPGAYRKGRTGRKIHCATKTFQALRIAVNDELGALKEGLDGGFKALKKGGRMAVISFHSLEDRIVKRFFKEKKEKGEAVLVNKKPITPGSEEIKSNPRSRSGKLRILEKIAD